MSLVLRVVLAILSTYRIAELIAVDDGPFDIFKKIRCLYNDGSQGIKLSFSKLVNCPFCIGVWIAFVISFVVLFPSIGGDFVLLFLGIAGGQTLLESLSKRFME